jgi:hypothetical protein
MKRLYANTSDDLGRVRARLPEICMPTLGIGTRVISALGHDRQTAGFISISTINPTAPTGYSPARTPPRRPRK